MNKLEAVIAAVLHLSLIFVYLLIFEARARGGGGGGGGGGVRAGEHTHKHMRTLRGSYQPHSCRPAHAPATDQACVRV